MDPPPFQWNKNSKNQSIYKIWLCELILEALKDVSFIIPYLHTMICNKGGTGHVSFYKKEGEDDQLRGLNI